MDKRQNVLDSFELKTDPLINHVKGFWIDIPLTAINSLKKLEIHLGTAVHVTEHILKNLVGENLKIDCNGYENQDVVKGTDKPKRNFSAR